MSKGKKPPKCCICQKRTVVHIPRKLPNGEVEFDLINMGACKNGDCILSRMRQG